MAFREPPLQSSIPESRGQDFILRIGNALGARVFRPACLTRPDLTDVQGILCQLAESTPPGVASVRLQGRFANRPYALSQYLHRLALTLFDKFSGIDDFSPRSGWIPGHCQNGRNVIRDFGRMIKIEQLVTRTNVPSHETFAGLLGEPSDDRRDTIANRHDR